MKKLGTALVLLLAPPLMGGCTSSDGLFEAKPAPDEFAVYSRAPLSLPPDFSLRPPSPGQSRPQSQNPRGQAEKALKGSAGKPPPAAAAAAASPGIKALLKDTGGLEADPDIRLVINRETSSMSNEDPSLTDRLMSWTAKGQQSKRSGIALDPESESRRIQTNQAQGRPISTGRPAVSAPAPKITRDQATKDKGFWDNLF